MPIVKQPAPHSRDNAPEPRAAAPPPDVQDGAEVLAPPPEDAAFAQDPEPRRRMRILARCGRDLSLTLDAGRVYTLLLNGAMLLTRARGAVLCLYREDQNAEIAGVQDLP